MTATQKATDKLRDNLIKQCSENGLGFRLIGDLKEPSVKGFRIIVDNECPGDKVIETSGIKIYLDPISAIVLENYVLDYTDDPNGGFCLKERESGCNSILGSAK